MPQNYDVLTDKHGRIKSFSHDLSSGNFISPGFLQNYLDGGERAILDGTEYDIQANGSLVHPSVNVPDAVLLGAGVRIERGTKFHFEPNFSDTIKDAIMIDNYCRIGNLESGHATGIYYRAKIGHHALVAARAIGAAAQIGDYTRINRGTYVMAEAEIGSSVRIGHKVLIKRGAKIGNLVRIRDHSTIGKRAIIGNRAEIGDRVPKQSGKGVTIANAQVVLKGAMIKS